jgi:hypothetical protein
MANRDAGVVGSILFLMGAGITRPYPIPAVIEFLFPLARLSSPALRRLSGCRHTAPPISADDEHRVPSQWQSRSSTAAEAWLVERSVEQDRQSLKDNIGDAKIVMTVVLVDEVFGRYEVKVTPYCGKPFLA